MVTVPQTEVTGGGDCWVGAGVEVQTVVARPDPLLAPVAITFKRAANAPRAGRNPVAHIVLTLSMCWVTYLVCCGNIVVDQVLVTNRAETIIEHW